jgi:hypothetical protein
MKLQKIQILMLALLLCQLARAQEYRLGVEYGLNLLPKLEVGAEAEIHKSFMPESYFVKRIQGKLNYDLTPTLSIGTSYTFSLFTEKGEDDEDEDGTETEEKSKWAADLTFQPKRFSNDVRLTNRLRYEYASSHEEEPKQYIRDKVTLDCKITKCMNPYFAFEPYYQTDRNKIRFVRFYIGNEMPVFKTKIDFYYLTELEIKPENKNIQYILGIMVSID